jgi:hypothetical protein
VALRPTLSSGLPFSGAFGGEDYLTSFIFRKNKFQTLDYIVQKLFLKFKSI